MNLGQDDLRSNCPINYSLELVGDRWSLLIVRDIVYFGKKTYGEFIQSNEGIARNILAKRLVQLVDNGILTKGTHPSDGRKDIYELTEKGLDLIPILLDMADWGSVHYDQSDAPAFWIAFVRSRREEIIAVARKTVRQGGSIFVGSDSVIAKITAEAG